MASLRLALKRSLADEDKSDDSEGAVPPPASAPIAVKKPRKPAARKPAAEKPPPKRRKTARSSEDEDGERGKGGRGGKDASSGSDDDGGGGNDIIDDGYDKEFYKDEEDKNRLLALPEVERESILFERAEQRKERLERHATMQRIIKARAGIDGGESVKVRAAERQKAAVAQRRADVAAAARDDIDTSSSSEDDRPLPPAAKPSSAKKVFDDSPSDSSDGRRSLSPSRRDKGRDRDTRAEKDSYSRRDRSRSHSRDRSPGRPRSRQYRSSSSERGGSDGGRDRRPRRGGTRRDGGGYSGGRSPSSSNSDGGRRGRGGGRRRSNRSRSPSSDRPRQRDHPRRRVASESEGSDVSDGRRRDQAPRYDQGPPVQEPKPVPVEYASIDDINHCRVPRELLTKWVNEPYFEEAVLHSYVKLGIGQRNGKSIYRVCEIVGFGKRSNAYSLPDGTFTAKLLLLKHGSDEKEFKMDIVSNHTIKEEEYKVWRQALEKANITPPTAEACKVRQREMQEKATSHQYSMKDVAGMINRRREGKGHTNVALTKIRLEHQVSALQHSVEDMNKQLAVYESEKQAAEDRSENIANHVKDIADLQERLQKANDEIARCEKEKMRNELADSKRREISEIADRKKKMRAVNEKNRGINATNDSKARQEQGAENGQGKSTDPFARRACRPKILWTVKHSPTRDRSGSPMPNGGSQPPVAESKTSVDDGAIEMKGNGAPPQSVTQTVTKTTERMVESLVISTSSLPGHDTKPPELTPRTLLHEQHGSIGDILAMGGIGSALSGGWGSGATAVRGGGGDTAKPKPRVGKGMSINDYLKKARQQQFE